METKSIGIFLYYFENSYPYFLMLKHNKSIYGLNHWDFVKGKPIKNESETRTGLREVFEETKLKNVKINSRFRAVSKYSFIKNSGEKVEKEVIFLLGEINKKDISKIKISDEHEKYMFVPIVKVKDYLEFDEIKTVFDKAVKFLQKP